MTPPRHRRPDREKTNPASEFYVPNDPANRIATPDSGHRPQHVPRKTLLETAADLGGTVEEQKLQKRLQEAQDENGGYPEATTCPLCNTPAMLVGPGQVSCPCRPEPFHVGTELAKRRDKLDAERRMILQCMREDQARGQPGGGGSSNGRTRKEPPKAKPRLEQGWAGFAEPEKESVVVVDKFVVCLKGKVPRAIKARLKAEATASLTTESHLLRWCIDRHLRGLEEAVEVEYGTDTVMLKVLVTREHAELWAAMKDVLQAKQVESTHTVSNADIMTAVMLREWT